MRFAKGVVLGSVLLFGLSVAAVVDEAYFVPKLTLSPAEMAPRPGPRFWTGDIPAGAVVFCGDWAWGQSGYFCCVPTAEGCGEDSGIAVPMGGDQRSGQPSLLRVGEVLEPVLLQEAIADTNQRLASEAPFEVRALGGDVERYRVIFLHEPEPFGVVDGIGKRSVALLPSSVSFLEADHASAEIVFINFEFHAHKVSASERNRLLTSSRVERIVLGKGLAARAVHTTAFPRTQRAASSYKLSAHMGARCRFSGGHRTVLLCSFVVASLAPANLSQGLAGANHNRSNTMATPLPPERMLASLREVLADQHDLFAATGSRTNTALASAAERESEQQLLQVMGALQLSPMYALAVEEFRLDLRRAGAADLSDSPDADSSLRLLCARLFLAGVSVEA